MSSCEKGYSDKPGVNVTYAYPANNSRIQRMLRQGHAHLARQVAHWPIDVRWTSEVEQCACELGEGHDDYVQSPVLQWPSVYS